MVTRLQKELRQTKPFTSREEEVFLGILRTAEQLSWGMMEVLRPVELTPTQYNALRILRGAGQAGVSCSEISERMVTKDSDITRLLDRLESRGLVSRERETKDRRRVVTRITDEGVRILAGLDETVLEHHRRLLGQLGERKLASLSKLLDEVREIQT